MSRKDSSVHSRRTRSNTAARLILLLVCWSPLLVSNSVTASRRQSAEEWHRLTATNAPLPRVLVHDDEIRFFFPTDSHSVGFKAKLGRPRIPTTGYQVSSALLKLERKLQPPPLGHSSDKWREPVIIAGREWRLLATNLLADLSPAIPGHAKHYRGLFGDRLLYRDRQGKVVPVPISGPPPGVIIDRRYSIEESLKLLAELAEPRLKQGHPGDSLFLLIVHPVRSPQPLLIDTARHRCVWLSSAGLFEPNEPAFPLAPTAQGIGALIFESNGLALLKNPVSSVARLGNLFFESLVSLSRLPFPSQSGPFPRWRIVRAWTWANGKPGSISIREPIANTVPSGC